MKKRTGERIATSLKLILALITALLFSSVVVPQTTIAIRNVTVIDMVSRSPKAGTTVIIQDGRIARIGRGVKAPKGAAIIDGRGKFLIPGLWDMHSHFLFEGLRDSFMKLTLVRRAFATWAVNKWTSSAGSSRRLRAARCSVPALSRPVLWWMVRSRSGNSQ
ncbi:MAG TPA: hypothetical protein VNA22_03610 [Pyrinomonadaceae bacterium]|nr:hypothetical protein [Pyrinomonadaceae bacterium]